jgi:hypothetical protein
MQTTSLRTPAVLANGVPYPGPRYLTDSPSDGRIPIGPYADGTGEADYVAVDAVGCRNGLATGYPRSGKSAFLEAVTLGLRVSGRWTVLFGDGDPGGGSSPLLNRLADWPAAGPDQVMAQLHALEELLAVRAALKVIAGPDGTPTPVTEPTREVPLREMLPTPGYPGVCWVLDELRRLTQDDRLRSQDFPARVEKIARTGPEYGIVILAGTLSLLADGFGGNTALRAALSARNCFLFRDRPYPKRLTRARSRIARGLPPGGGYAFSARARRSSMLRVAWARDLSQHLAGLPEVALDPDSERVLAGHRASAGDSATLAAAGPPACAELITPIQEGAWDSGDSMGEWVWQWRRELGAGKPPTLPGVPTPAPTELFDSP